MIRFNSVKRCKDTEEFNHFVAAYLHERGITDPDLRRRYYYALLHRWKGD